MAGPKRVPRPKRPRPFLTYIQKLIKWLLAFLHFHQHTRNQFISLITSWDTTNFISVLRPEWLNPFLTPLTPIFLNQLLISMNLYQHARSQAFLSFFSRDVVNLTILQSDWPRTFWPLSREKIFPKNGISARIQKIM